MKKLLKFFTAAMFACLLSVCFIACGKKDDNADSQQSSNTSISENSASAENSESGAGEHNCAFGDWYETRAAKCEEAGEERRDCDCGEFETRPIEPTGHTYVNGVCACNAKYQSTGLLYEISPDNSYYTVTGRGNCEDSTVYIPETYKEKPVKAVGANAFKGQSISGVILPDSITSIENGAFENCSALENVRLGSGLTEIGDGAFTLCVNITVIVLPETLEAVGNGAFEGCSKLEAVKIPDKVQSLGDNAFKGCSALGNVQLGSGLTEIGDGAFTLCVNITVIVLPETLETVGNGAFEGCSKLEAIKIPDKVQSLGNNAFKGCSALENVQFGNGLTEIGDGAFTLCINITVIILGENVTVMGENVFDGCEKLLGVLFAEESIPKGWAENAVSKEILYTKGDWEYADGENETSVVFYGEWKVYTPAKCGLKGEERRYGVNNAEKYQSRPIEALEHSYTAYESNGDATCTKDGTKTATCDNGCGLTDILPDEGSAKGHDFVNGACVNCSEKKPSEGLLFKLNEDEKSYAVIGIGSCADIELVIPSIYKNLPVTVIESSAFSGCSTLTSVKIPDSIILIGEAAFSGCSSLIEITLPFVGDCIKSSTDMYQYPFGYIFGETSYVGGAITKQYYYGSSLSELTYSNYYIPTSLKSVRITGGNILERAFFNCVNLTKISIPDGITNIGSDAFSSCHKLTDINIPDSVISIGTHAFSACSLTNITIPDSVTSIGSYAFSNNSKLENVTIGKGIVSIEEAIFLRCSSLVNVKIPDSVISIGKEAFMYCSNLESIAIPNSVTSIGESAFQWCKKLRSVTIGKGVMQIQGYAFYTDSDLTMVYYRGTESNWENIKINAGNTKLTQATRYYYSETQPATSGNFWYYDENGEIAVW